MSTRLSTRVRLHNEFFRKYDSALRSIVATFNKEKPDYIIALSRKAPRLLELIRLSGLWSGNIPVISEKALDFIPAEQLSQKKVVVFDDIIVSGTTVKELVAELMHKYQLDIVVVCLAVDVDTIALKIDSNGDYGVTLDDGNSIPIYHQVPLKRDDRFIFCNEIVRSFAFLNKPYDIDFPIFYTHLNARPLDSPPVQIRADKSYNLTTVYQYDAGFSRYTLLPAEPPTTNGLCSAMIRGSPVFFQISKVREYINNKTGDAAFCSIVTFQIERGLLKGNKLFTDAFSHYDDLVEIARPFIDPNNETQAVYRLVCYMVSYLYGLAFSLRNMEENENFAVMRPSDVLSQVDLLYIFGMGLTKAILHFLDLHHAETLDLLKRIQETFDTIGSDGEHNEEASENFGQTFDKSRDELLNTVLPYITTHVHSEQSLTDRLATIFEGLYYCSEIPIQDVVRKDGIRGDEYRRLGVGFSYSQMMEILQSNNLLGSDSGEPNLSVSLSLDFLVDTGIAIPIFFYERSDGVYERAYRYGEDALSAKKYGYLIASTVKSLFEFLHEDQNRQVLPKITYEKLGVLLQEEIERSGVVDLLKELLPSGDREMSISPHFARHGKILHISDEAYERSQYYPNMFNEWSEKEGIINSVTGGVAYSGSFFEKLRFSNGYLPQLMPADKVAIFESLAMLLCQLDKYVDEKGQSDYLIALTACGDRESYLWALREELSLFFKSKVYCFSESLGRTASYLKDAEHRTGDFLDQALRWCNKSLSAAHGTRHKKTLQENIPQIVDDIEKHFASNAQLRLLYDQNLRFHIDKIKVAHSMRAESAFEKLKSGTEVLGELCILLASVLENLLDLAIETHKIRITKEGKPHRADMATTARRLDSLHRCMEEWDIFIRGNTAADIVGLSAMPSKVSDELFLAQLPNNKNDFYQLIASVIAAIQKNYIEMERLYDQNYSPAIWRQKMEELFPDGNNLELVAVRKAIESAEKCVSEDRRIHPKVSAVIIKDGQVVCTAYRGEKRSGDHAEYTALFDKEKALNMDLRGATLITTLEPCTSRKHDNKPCALHIVERGIERVIVGMVDPNPEIRGKGILFLQRKNIKVDLFPTSQQEQVRKLNQEFWDQEWEHYKIDIMKDSGGASETQVQSIAGDFYSLDTRRIRVFEVLRTGLESGEDKILCETYLSMNYDDLQGATRIDRINTLVSRFARRDRLDDLLEAIGRFNPNILKLINNYDLPA